MTANVRSTSDTDPRALAPALPRAAGRRVENALDVSPVVVVMGARQVGKSTLVRTLPALGEYLYVTLDDLDARDQATLEPDALVMRAPYLILDEVQRHPDLMLAIKRAVDRDHPRRPGRFVLTGSANLLLMDRVSESLAGRASYVSLWPFTRREQMGRGQTGTWDRLFEVSPEDWYEELRRGEPQREDWRAWARRGGYPTPALELETEEQRAEWFEGYVRTYLERDLQDLSAIDRLTDFRRLMRAACLRIGNLLNQSELARDTGLPQPTVHRYLNLLEASFQLLRIEPYSVNRTKRLIKSPKLYWTDVGLALHIAGDPEPGGAHLESLVFTDLLAWREAQTARPEILYWRTASGQEVDFVIEHQRQLVGIEVKASARVRVHDARHLRAFRQEYSDLVRGCLVLYDGDETFWLEEGTLAIPWWRIL